MTKDEKLLLELYKAILKRGEASGTANPFQVGKKLGYNEHLVKNILKGLMQANLVKGYSPEEVRLTERGLKVAAALAG